MLCVAAMEHPPYLQPELRKMTRHYYGRHRWERWLADRQYLRAFSWYPATREERPIRGLIPRLTATYTRPWSGTMTLEG
jgi:hypothetical protein